MEKGPPFLHHYIPCHFSTFHQLRTYTFFCSRMTEVHFFCSKPEYRCFPSALNVSLNPASTTSSSPNSASNAPFQFFPCKKSAMASILHKIESIRPSSSIPKLLVHTQHYDYTFPFRCLTFLYSPVSPTRQSLLLFQDPRLHQTYNSSSCFPVNNDDPLMLSDVWLRLAAFCVFCVFCARGSFFCSSRIHAVQWAAVEEKRWGWRQ